MFSLFSLRDQLEEALSKIDYAKGLLQQYSNGILNIQIGIRVIIVNDSNDSFEKKLLKV